MNAAALADCTRLMAGGSKSFFAASRVLPARVRAPAVALYAFCRVADDAIDEAGNGAQAQAALERLYDRLDAAYSGTPHNHPIDRAFSRVVADHAIPRTLPAALLEGFAWDAQARRYDTFDDLQAYAARVAGTVGAMMSLVMGRRAPAVLARACDLGVAMQLTNIARDVGEDARMRRLYLPLQWLRAEGLDPDEWLLRPNFDERLGRVVQSLLREADRLYAQASTGIGALPSTCRPAMQAAGRLYAEIGREVERQGLDSVNQRAVVAGRRKLVLLGGALLRACAPASLDQSPPLPQTRFLVDAVVPLSPAAHARRHFTPFGLIEQRLLGLLALFERLERRDRALQTTARRLPA